MRLLFTALQVVIQLAGRGQKVIDLYEQDCIAAHPLYSRKAPECTLWVPQGSDLISLRVGTAAPDASTVFDRPECGNAESAGDDLGEYLLDGDGGEPDAGYTSRTTSYAVWPDLPTSASAVGVRELWHCETVGARTKHELHEDARCALHLRLLVGQAVWLDTDLGRWEPGKALEASGSSVSATTAAVSLPYINLYKDASADDILGNPPVELQTRTPTERSLYLEEVTNRIREELSSDEAFLATIAPEQHSREVERAAKARANAQWATASDEAKQPYRARAAAAKTKASEVRVEYERDVVERDHWRVTALTAPVPNTARAFVHAKSVIEACSLSSRSFKEKFLLDLTHSSIPHALSQLKGATDASAIKRLSLCHWAEDYEGPGASGSITMADIMHSIKLLLTYRGASVLGVLSDASDGRPMVLALKTAEGSLWLMRPLFAEPSQLRLGHVPAATSLHGLRRAAALATTWADAQSYDFAVIATGASNYVRRRYHQCGMPACKHCLRTLQYRRRIIC